MVGIRRVVVTTIVVAAVLVPAGWASAGPIKDFFCPDCPPPDYSPFRFWAPRGAKAYDDLHGPKIDVYAPDRHPEIPSATTILKFKCPPVEPGATLIEPPTPPATSKFRY
jgi:hypothetical protein